MKTVLANTHLRWMIRRDMPDILRIEATRGKDEWPEEDFLRSLRQRNAVGMVVEDNYEKVIGYMVYELHNEMVKLLTFVVDPEYRRQGVGRKLLDKLKTKLVSHRRSKLVFMVKETNLDALRFFRAGEIKAVGVEWDHFDDEDGIQMEFHKEDESSSLVSRIAQHIV